MSKKVPDRRIARTRASLGFALFSLMERQSWASITIQQICDHANVARASFYAHFDTKIALLDFLIAEQFIRQESSKLHQQETQDYAEILGWLVDHVTTAKPLFSRIAQDAEALPVVARFKSALAGQLAAAMKRDGLVASETTIAFVLGGTFDALIAWSRHWKIKQVPQLRADILAIAAKVVAFQA